LSLSFFGRKEWHAGSAQALVFASLAGAATPMIGFALALFGYGGLPGLPDAWGNRVSMVLTLTVDFMVALVPVAVACALGVVIFGVPLSRRFGGKFVAGGFAIFGIAWGGVAGERLA
jgi:hypothetical protein